MPATDATVRGASGPIHQLDARRAYYVFLTHIIKAHSVGLRWPVSTVAEFGVGTHLGIGFCALLTGAQRYCGFDAVAHMDASAQTDLLDELRGLFWDKAPAHNDAGNKAFDFPLHAFPAHVLERGTLESTHIALRAELDKLSNEGRSDKISYIAPYDAACAQQFAQSADLLLSTATLEHIDDMEGGYALFHAMLKRGAIMSHSIDFKSHGFGKDRNGKRLWNEHWLLDDAEWREITRGKAYSINRLTCSEHLKLMTRAGFRLLLVNKRTQETDIKWSDLAPAFQWMTLEDLTCTGVHIVLTK